VLGAGYEENALRRVPVAFVGLAQELRLRNAGTNKDMLNPSQVKDLARTAKSLSTEDREGAVAYAKAALAAISTGAAGSAVTEFLDTSSLPNPGASVWHPAPIDLFEIPEKTPRITADDIRDTEQLIDATINSFVPAEVRHDFTKIGPRIMRFGALPTGTPVLVNGVPKRDASGRVLYAKRTKIEQITNREKDIQAALGVKTIRMLPPVPGEHHVGIEIPNPRPMTVSLRDVLASKEYQAARAASKLVFVLGQNVAGEVLFCDIERAPHLLIAGATGAGKSMLLNTLLASILTQATPDDVRLLMIDPKLVELTIYKGIPHLLRPVVTDVQQVVPLLNNAVAEMDRRYQLFSELGLRNLAGYRKLRLEKLAGGDTSLANLPAIVIIIDELADLMMTAPEEVEGLICRLAQKARAIGIHLVVATQRPSVDVITGLIKANIPTRIAFMVASWRDSQTILDQNGAEKLLGRGDMLYLPSDVSEPERVQGAYMTDGDAARLAAYWRETQPSATSGEVWPDETEEEEEIEEIDPDPPAGENTDDEQLLATIIEKLTQQRMELFSKSWLQKLLSVGYPKADRLTKKLVELGVVTETAEGKRGERRVLLQYDRTEDSVDDGSVAQSGVV